MSKAQQATSSSTEQIDVIITTSGGDSMAKAAYRGGALLGMNSSQNRPANHIPLEFIDWPFLEDDFSFSDHLNVVKREKPRYAVAPDIQTPEEFTRRIAQADRLARHAETVIVVPKGVKPERIPTRFRVGLPAQEKFGGNPWPVWEYRNCRSVHILGGSPNTQFELEHYANVDSVDTASPLKAASFGNVWDGTWGEAGHNYYDRIERSMDNLLSAWNEQPDESRVNSARLETPQPEPCPVPDDRKTRPPTREEMCLSPEEKRPFPGREFFERRDTTDWSDYKNEM
jgi:hypothetical protein